MLETLPVYGPEILGVHPLAFSHFSTGGKEPSFYYSTDAQFFFPQKIRSLFCFSWYVLNPLLRWRWRHQNSPSPKKHHLVLGYGKLSLLCLFLPSLRIWGATVGDEPMFLKNISCLQTLSLFPVVFTGFACSNYFCEVFLIAWRHCFDTSMSSFI